MTINSLCTIFCLLQLTMSAPSTPSPHAGGTAAKITPPSDKPGESSGNMVHSMSETLDFFLDILDEEPDTRDKLKQGIERLLMEHWRVRKWGDLKFFTSADVKEALVSGNGMPEELLAPVIIK